MLQEMFGDVCEDGIDAYVNMVDIIAYFTSNNYEDVCVGGGDVVVDAAMPDSYVFVCIPLSLKIAKASF